jgi:hypothetical protein
MTLSRLLFVSVGLCAVAAVHAEGACDTSQERNRDSVRLVDSLRPEKPGQMRVFAADGAQFNAGQVQWLKGQLRKVDRLCARRAPGDEAEAAKALAGVTELLAAHHRGS